MSFEGRKSAQIYHCGVGFTNMYRENIFQYISNIHRICGKPVKIYFSLYYGHIYFKRFLPVLFFLP